MPPDNDLAVMVSGRVTRRIDAVHYTPLVLRQYCQYSAVVTCGKESAIHIPSNLFTTVIQVCRNERLLGVGSERATDNLAEVVQRDGVERAKVAKRAAGPQKGV